MNTSTIIECIEKVIPNGYQIQINKGTYLNFVKVENDRIIVIGFGSIITGIFKGVRADISFISVESIIHKEFAKKLDTNYGVTIHTRQHGLIFNKTIGEEVYNHLPIPLETEADLARACELVQTFIQQDTLPFFNYWQDIRDFLPFLETDDLRYVANTVFAGYGPEKKLVIWKLCNHPRYEEHAKFMYERIKEGLKAEPKNESYKGLIKLIEKLEKVKPIYDWDDSYLVKKNQEV